MKRPEDAIGNIAGLQQAIDDSEFDAMLIVSPENLRYASDVVLSSQIKIRDRLTVIVWAKGRAPIMVICVVWEALMRRGTWIEDLRTYREFYQRPIALVAEVLRELKLEGGRIGYEGEYLGGLYCDELRQDLPGMALAPCDTLIQGVRSFKTAREVELLRHAYRGTANALFATFVSTVPGQTESSVAHRLSDNIMRSGADAVTTLVFGAGANTGLHMEAGNYQVQAGDILKSDCGGHYAGYYSNVGRTAKLGPLTDEDRSIWRRLREIQHALSDMLRPGVSGREIFERCVTMHRERELPFAFGHNGHGVGLMIHENPLIAPHEELVYQAGMVSTVETRVRWPGKVGYHMEDLFLVTDQGPVQLSDAFDNEEILVV
ncbi:MAG: Xaa-Pro peptidase family protein [Burkholderiaceae bacterium]